MIICFTNYSFYTYIEVLFLCINSKANLPEFVRLVQTNRLALNKTCHSRFHCDTINTLIKVLKLTAWSETDIIYSDFMEKTKTPFSALLPMH